MSGKADEFLIEKLIRQTQTGHESAVCQLREYLESGVRWYLKRNAAETSVETDTRQVIDTVILGVRNHQVASIGDLATLTRLSAQTSAAKSDGARSKTKSVDRRKVEDMKTALHELEQGEREVLVRYFEGQSPERICADLKMTSSALNALRARVRSRCAELASHP